MTRGKLVAACGAAISAVVGFIWWGVREETPVQDQTTGAAHIQTTAPTAQPVSPPSPPALTEPPRTSSAEEFQRFIDHQMVNGKTIHEIKASPEYARLSPEAKTLFARWLAPAQASLDQAIAKILSGEIPRQMDRGIEGIKAEEVRKAMNNGAAALHAVEGSRTLVPAASQDPVIRSLVRAYGELVTASVNLAAARSRITDPPKEPNPSATVTSLRRELELLAADDRGVRALAFAADEGKYYSAQVLVAAGVDPRAIGPDGRNALQIAEARGYSRIVELLRTAAARR